MSIPRTHTDPADVQGEPRTGKYGYSADGNLWWASGNGWIVNPDGSSTLGYGRTGNGKPQPTEEAAIAKWRESVARDIDDSAYRREVRARFHDTAKAIASRRMGLMGWGFNRGLPEVNERVKVWGYGGFRIAVVVEVLKTRAVVAWTTPNNPDLHIQTLPMSKVARAPQPPIVTA